MSGSRANTRTAAAARSRWSRPREREATRLAILDATQRLIDVHGLETLTLSAIADEAGLARATLYGYFSSKRQLLAQLNGEDLPEPSPPADEQPSDDQPRMDAASEPLPEADMRPAGEQPPANEIREPSPMVAEETPEGEQRALNQASVVPAGDKHETTTETAHAAADSADYAEMMRLQAEELDRLAKRIIVPKSMTRDGTDIVITRLDARVRVMEKSVADLEARRGQDTKDLADRIDAAIDAVQQLQKRLEADNSRHQLALAEIRLDVHNLANAENGTAARPSEFRDEPAAKQVEPICADIETTPVDASPTTPEPDRPPVEPVQRPYLSSARRAAIEAARQASIRDDGGAGSQDNRWRWLLGVFLLIAAALGVVIGTRPHASAHDASVRKSSQSIAQLMKERGAVSGFDRLEAMAASGNASAQLVLGLKLLNGTGVAMNIEKAAGWLRRAAESGQPVAQESLGVLYQTGTGVIADGAKAARWYEASALQGNVKAMANLAKTYAGGSAQGPDVTKAVRWFTRAAKLGDVDSQFDLAVLFERGEGVPRSLSDAYKWYSIAAGQGDRDAAAQAVVLAAQLSPQELAAAKKAVAGFKPGPVEKRANNLPSIAVRSAERS